MQKDRLESLNQKEAIELLAFYNELGWDEAINEQSINRFEKNLEPIQKTNIRKVNPKLKNSKLIPDGSALQVAISLAKKTTNLAQLKSALATFEFCDLRNGARNLVFGDGDPASEVMIIGDAPNPEEDRQGKPFVGDAGDLLDKMFSAIGLSRNSTGLKGIYVSTIIPWKPLHTQSSIRTEIDLLFPFIEKHIQLINPRFLIIMGSDPSTELFHRIGGNERSENWGKFLGIDTVKIHHPGYLIKNPNAKKEAWKELLELKARLDEI
mgnify:FL=1